MKKICLFLAILMLLSVLASCSSGLEPVQEEPTPSVTTKKPIQKKTEEETEVSIMQEYDPAQDDVINVLMIGNSVKSDIAPVVSLGGWAIHTPHEVVWVHEMMDMPQNDRIIEVKNIREILSYLL